MPKLMYVHAVPSTPDGYNKHPITFHLLLNDEGRCVSKSIMGGFLGWLTSGDLAPFIFNPGKSLVDFGTEFNGQDRRYHTDIATAPLRVGGMFYFCPEGSTNGPDFLMKIKRVDEAVTG